MTEQAQEAAEKYEGTQRVPTYDATRAWREAEVGNFDLARRQARKVLMVSDDRAVKAIAGVTLATAGDNAAANRLAEDLTRRYPSDTHTQNYVLPTILALIELNQGRSANAIKLLQPTLSLELAFGDFAYMEPTYVRGLAYLQLGKGAEAAAEFQKMLDHRGVVGNFVTGALAHLQLGRAEEMSGHRDAARTHYQDFFPCGKTPTPMCPF